LAHHHVNTPETKPSGQDPSNTAQNMRRVVTRPATSPQQDSPLYRAAVVHDADTSSSLLGKIKKVFKGKANSPSSTSASKNDEGNNSQSD